MLLDAECFISKNWLILDHISVLWKVSALGPSLKFSQFTPLPSPGWPQQIWSWAPKKWLGLLKNFLWQQLVLYCIWNLRIYALWEEMSQTKHWSLLCTRWATKATDQMNRTFDGTLNSPNELNKTLSFVRLIRFIFQLTKQPFSANSRKLSHC